MLLDQWKQFTEEQVKSLYPPEQVETTFAADRIKDYKVSSVDSCLPELYFVGVGRLKAHVDGDFPEFSYHLILVNTGLIAKGIDQDASKKPQTPGTIIVLHAWEYHHVVDDLRVRTSDNPIWVSICFDSVDVLPKEEVIKYFEKFLRDDADS